MTTKRPRSAKSARESQPRPWWRSDEEPEYVYDFDSGEFRDYADDFDGADLEETPGRRRPRSTDEWN